MTKDEHGLIVNFAFEDEEFYLVPFILGLIPAHIRENGVDSDLEDIISEEDG